MIDKLISSGLAALARENQQRIPAFVPPPPRARAASFVLTTAHVLAVAPTITMLVVGVALLGLDVAPFGHYEPYVMPFVIAIVSLAGLVSDRTRDPRHATALRAQATSILAGGALVIGMVGYLLVVWPGYSLRGYFDDGGLYAVPIFGGNRWVQGPGLIVIIATLAVLLARLAAGRTKAAWLAKRRDLDAWGTCALIVGVLVVVVWANAFDFENGQGWSLVSFRMPDPTIRHHLVEYMSAEMWRALEFRPWSYSPVSAAQWDLGAAVLVVAIVAAVTGVAIAREQRVARRSRWLQLLELPAVLPLFVIIGTANVARAIIADYPREAARPFAWAVAGVMLAFTSMILRRRRSIRAREPQQ